MDSGQDCIMHDRMPVASTELTHDQASRNWGGGGGEARKDSLIAGVWIRD